MNDVLYAIYDYDIENLLELMVEVWEEERPETPDHCESDWRHNFIDSYAESLKCYYKDILNDSELDPIIKYIIDYGSIDWQELAKKVVLSTDKLDVLIDKFADEYENERWNGMTPEEQADHYRELEGDRQYEAMIDDMISGR